MIVYKALLKPVLIFGISYRAFYGGFFITFGLFMGTLNLLIPILAILIYIIVRYVTQQDYDFFSVLKRSWHYKERIS